MVFIIPDRTKEERLARRKLVKVLRIKIEEEPHRYHFIQKGQVNSTSSDHDNEVKQVNALSYSNNQR